MHWCVPGTEPPFFLYSSPRRDDTGSELSFTREEMGTEELLVQGHSAGKWQLGLPTQAHLDSRSVFMTLT